jgi:type II secretory pathway pseudopilin PulG
MAARLLHSSGTMSVTKATGDEMTTETRRHRDSARGASMVEVLFSMLVMGIIMGMCLVAMQPAVQQFRANEGMNIVMSEMRLARQMSVAQRRDIQVQFVAPNEIKLTLIGVVNGNQLINDMVLPPTVVYMTFPTESDSPDGFGDAAPVYFAGLPYGPATMMFQSDGTFVNGNGTPINGTVFLGVISNPPIPTTARAITILGTTGQVRTYKGTGTGWIVP